MSSIKLSHEQILHLAKERVKSRARHWTARVDQTVDDAQRQQPEGRLAALLQAVIADLPPQAVFEAADVKQCANVLAKALRAGAPWSDTRGAAQLHAAAGLGLLWYMDDRLLEPGDQILAAASQPDTLVTLLADPQGQRFKRAAMRAKLRGPGLRMTLHRALQQECADASIHTLLSSAFALLDEPDELGQGEAEKAGEAEHEGEVPDWPPAARTFIAKARELQALAGLRDPGLTRLCLAGDLAFGLGRCVRLLAADGVAASRPPAKAIDFLNESLHAATGHQH